MDPIDRHIKHYVIPAVIIIVVLFGGWTVYQGLFTEERDDPPKEIEPVVQRNPNEVRGTIVTNVESTAEERKADLDAVVASKQRLDGEADPYLNGEYENSNHAIEIRKQQSAVETVIAKLKVTGQAQWAEAMQAASGALDQYSTAIGEARTELGPIKGEEQQDAEKESSPPQ